MKPYSGYNVKAVLRIALPIMVSAMGHTSMITIDRIMISKFDEFAMPSLVFIGTLLYLFEASASSITLTSQIFAGQYHGSNQYEKVAQATWQMLYISLIFAVITICLGLFGGKYLIIDIHYQKMKDVYKILMIFLFLSPAIGAINGFFIGIKRPLIVSVNAILCNILNIIFNYIFIFGITGFVKPLGLIGSAIGTAIAQSIQFIVIFLSFLRRKYNNVYYTQNFHFKPKLLLNCLKIGIPSSIGMFVDIYSSFTTQKYISIFAPQYIAPTAIGINVIVILLFMIIGIEKSVSTISANMIGENKIDNINKLIKTAFKVHILLSCIIFVLVNNFAENIAKIYTKNSIIISDFVSLSPYVILYYFLDGMAWIVCGALIAGGNSQFVMFSTFISNFLFRLLPLYLILKSGYSSPSLAWIISSLSTLVFFFMTYYKVKQKNWIKVNVTAPSDI